ncbi:MAG TPA: glycosyltransferase family A protein [Opitutaceae bacterium]|nr:glycosyltransferase family A protein [Opitutaceae bacterium]
MRPPAENPPAVSVVIPTYRHAAYVEETLRSVFAQTFSDFEVIVINDGSPDNTAAVLRPWVESGRIRYHEQPNAGQSATRNRAIELARGEFIALLDDDDLWPPDKLAWQVESLRRNPRAVLCYGYAQTFGMEQNYRLPAAAGPQGAVGEEFLRGNPISSPGQVLLRAQTVRELRGFDPAIRGTEDWDLWIRLGRTGEFVYEDRCSLLYRLQSQNASQNAPKMFHAGLQVLHKHLGRTPLNARWRLWLQTRGFVGRFSSMIAFGQAFEAASAGNRSLALSRLAGAVRFFPPLLGTRRFWSALARCLAKPSAAA